MIGKTQDTISEFLKIGKEFYNTHPVRNASLCEAYAEVDPEILPQQRSPIHPSKFIAPEMDYLLGLGSPSYEASNASSTKYFSYFSRFEFHQPDAGISLLL